MTVLPVMCAHYYLLCQLQNKVMDISPSNKRPVGGLNLGPAPAEPVIVHAGVITSMLHLLPSIQHATHPRLACLLQLYTAHLIKVLTTSVILALWHLFVKDTSLINIVTSFFQWFMIKRYS